MGRHPLLTPEELDALAEIDRLLDEANEHAFAAGDYGKSSEGWIQLHFGTHWSRREDVRYAPTVSIYAYMLGPHRNHEFPSIPAALETVRRWHAAEMAEPYCDDPSCGYSETHKHGMDCSDTCSVCSTRWEGSSLEL